MYRPFGPTPAVGGPTSVSVTNLSSEQVSAASLSGGGGQYFVAPSAEQTVARMSSPVTCSNAVVYPGVFPFSRFLPTVSAETSFGLIGDVRRDLDHVRKRPSMMSDFQAISAPISDGFFDASGKKVKSECNQGPRLLQRIPSVEVKKEPAYTPQVENISPTPEDEPTDKDRILDQIKTMDHDIAVVENQIKNLKKQQKELLEAADESSDSKGQVADLEIAGQSFFDQIYAETRKKAAASHAKYASLLPTAYPLPLYHEPADIPELIELRKRHEQFAPRLILHLKKLQQARQIRERYLTDRYQQLMQGWKRKIEKIESNQKRKLKEVKHREIFEKVFPELRKQREEKERLGRMETRSGLVTTVRSDSADREREQTESLAEQEEEERRVHQSAVVVPMLLDTRLRNRYKFLDYNGLVRDPVGEHQTRLQQFQWVWSDDEKQTFREKFAQYGKNFAAIAEFLERKETKDCVQFYYLTKKRENYRQLLRRGYKRKAGKPYKPPPMPRVGDIVKDEDVGEILFAESSEPEYFCVICKAKIDASNPGRVVTRQCYEQYGLDQQDISPNDVRICQKCRLGIVRKRHTHCPVASCTTAKRKVKATRVMPVKWSELTSEQKQLVSSELQFVADDMFKCCSGCFKRITRKIEMILNGGSDEESVVSASARNWSSDQTQQLIDAIAKLGTDDWSKIADCVLLKTSEQCQQYYQCQREQLSEEISKACASKQILAGVQGIEDEEEEEDVEASSDDVEDANNENSAVATPIASPKSKQVVCKMEAEDYSSCDLQQSFDVPMEVSLNPASASASKPLSTALTLVDKWVDDNDSNATLSADEETDDSLIAAASSSHSHADLSTKFMSVSSTQRAMASSVSMQNFHGSFHSDSLPQPQQNTALLKYTASAVKQELPSPINSQSHASAAAIANNNSSGSRQSGSSVLPTSYRKPKSDIAHRVELQQVLEQHTCEGARNEESEAEPEIVFISQSCATSSSCQSRYGQTTGEASFVGNTQRTHTVDQPTLSSTASLSSAGSSASSTSTSVSARVLGSITHGTPLRQTSSQAGSSLGAFDDVVSGQNAALLSMMMSSDNPAALSILTRSARSGSSSPHVATRTAIPDEHFRSKTPLALSGAGTIRLKEEAVGQHSFSLEKGGTMSLQEQTMMLQQAYERERQTAASLLQQELHKFKQAGCSEDQAMALLQQQFASAGFTTNFGLAGSSSPAAASNKQLLSDYLTAHQIQQQHVQLQKLQQQQQQQINPFAAAAAHNPSFLASLTQQLQLQQRFGLPDSASVRELYEQQRRLEAVAQQQQQQQQLDAQQRMLEQQRQLEQQRAVQEMQQQEQQRRLLEQQQQQQSSYIHPAFAAYQHAIGKFSSAEYQASAVKQEPHSPSHLVAHSRSPPIRSFSQQPVKSASPFQSGLTSEQRFTHSPAVARSFLMPTAAAGSSSPRLYDSSRASQSPLSHPSPRPQAADWASASGTSVLRKPNTQTPPAYFRTKGAMKELPPSVAGLRPSSSFSPAPTAGGSSLDATQGGGRMLLSSSSSKGGSTPTPPAKASSPATLLLPPGSTDHVHRFGHFGGQTGPSLGSLPGGFSSSLPASMLASVMPKREVATPSGLSATLPSLQAQSEHYLANLAAIDVAQRRQQPAGVPSIANTLFQQKKITLEEYLKILDYGDASSILQQSAQMNPLCGAMSEQPKQSSEGYSTAASFYDALIASEMNSQQQKQSQLPSKQSSFASASFGGPSSQQEKTPTVPFAQLSAVQQQQLQQQQQHRQLLPSLSVPCLQANETETKPSRMDPFGASLGRDSKPEPKLSLASQFSYDVEPISPPDGESLEMAASLPILPQTSNISSSSDKLLAKGAVSEMLPGSSKQWQGMPPIGSCSSGFSNPPADNRRASFGNANFAQTRSQQGLASSSAQYVVSSRSSAAMPSSSTTTQEDELLIAENERAVAALLDTQKDDEAVAASGFSLSLTSSERQPPASFHGAVGVSASSLQQMEARKKLTETVYEPLSDEET